MKINNFNDGTFIIKKDYIEYIVNATHCRFDNLADVQQDLTMTDDDFFNIKDIKKEGQYYHFMYEPENDYKSLLSAKRESKALKLSLLDYLLERNPLENNITVLSPSNIFYKNIKDIKIAFRGHELMPSPNISDLEQYKILIISMLSRFSYEKYMRNKKTLLSREKDSFFHKVNNAENLEDLKRIVKDELNNVQTEQLLNEEKRDKELRRKNMKRTLWGLLGLSVLMGLLSFLLINAKNNELNREIENAKISSAQSNIYKDLYEGDYKSAVQKMKKDKNFTKKQIIDVLKKENAYSELISYDSKQTPYVIEELYKNKDTSKIRELAYEFEDNEALSTEKAILDKDGSVFGLGTGGFYKEQNLRLAETAIDQGYLDTAININKTLKDKGLSKKIQDEKVRQLESELKNTKDKDKRKQLKSDIKEEKSKKF